MKDIFNEVKRIMVSGVYDDYRFIINPRIVELKLIPIRDSDDEINFVIENTKDKRKELLHQLQHEF